jgi:lactate 2-monooxygenase
LTSVSRGYERFEGQPSVAKMTDEEVEERPPYYTFQHEIYQKAVISGEKPVVTTDPNKLEHEARRAMKPEAFNYVFGGAGEHATMEANRLAFRQWKIIPRFLRPTLPRDLRVTLFGRTYSEWAGPWHESFPPRG